MGAKTAKSRRNRLFLGHFVVFSAFFRVFVTFDLLLPRGQVEAGLPNMIEP